MDVSLDIWGGGGGVFVGCIFLPLEKNFLGGGELGPGRYSDRSLFRQLDIPTGRCSDRSIFRQTGRYSDRSIFRQVVIPTSRYSDKHVVIPTGR